MLIRVRSPHLGEGYLKLDVETSLDLVFEGLRDLRCNIADIGRGVRALRRPPPLSFTRDTGEGFRDAGDDPRSPKDWLTIVNIHGEVLGFRLLDDPDAAWDELCRNIALVKTLTAPSHAPTE